MGETPLAAAFGDIAAYESIRGQQDNFFRNMARSAVLATDLNLDATQVQMLRDRWNDQSKGLKCWRRANSVAWPKSFAVVANCQKDLKVAELLKLANENMH